MASFDGSVTTKAVAVSWFRSEDYARIREISAGRDRLPKTFEEWQKLEEGKYVISVTVLKVAT